MQQNYVQTEHAESTVIVTEEFESQYRGNINLTVTSDSVHWTLSGFSDNAADVYKILVYFNNGTTPENDYNLTVAEQEPKSLKPEVNPGIFFGMLLAVAPALAAILFVLVRIAKTKKGTLCMLWALYDSKNSNWAPTVNMGFKKKTDRRASKYKRTKRQFRFKWMGVLAIILSQAVPTEGSDVTICQGGVFDMVLQHNPDSVYMIYLDKGESKLADFERSGTQWIRRITEEFESQNRDRLNISDTLDSVSLALSWLTANDTNVYKISVYLHNGLRPENHYNLTVAEPPLFDKEQRMYVVGNSEYACGKFSSYGNPPVKFNWMCDGDGTVRTTTTNTIKCEDCKKCYKCLAEGPAMDACGVTFRVTQPERNDDTGLSIGLAVGVVVGTVAVCAAVVLGLIIFTVRKKRRKYSAQAVDEDVSNELKAL